jgi:formate dehydrogenase subunit gamma
MQTKPAWNRETAEAIIAANLGRPNLGRQGAALPILHALQAEFGCVHSNALPLIAAALNISRAEIHGIVTFYHDFRATPSGRHVLRLCRAEACQSAGAVTLAEQARAWLGLDWGGTSADGAVTLEAVYCLGLCACAPAAMLDGKPVGRLTPHRMDALLQESTR